MADRDRKLNKDSVRIGTCIRIARERLGLSQDELASMVGVGTNSLSKVETGKNNFSFDHFLRLVRALDAEPGVLIFGTPLRMENGEEQIIRESRIEYDGKSREEVQKLRALLRSEINRMTEEELRILLDVSQAMRKRSGAPAGVKE